MVSCLFMDFWSFVRERPILGDNPKPDFIKSSGFHLFLGEHLKWKERTVHTSNVEFRHLPWRANKKKAVLHTVLLCEHLEMWYTCILYDRRFFDVFIFPQLPCCDYNTKFNHDWHLVHGHESFICRRLTNRFLGIIICYLHMQESIVSGERSFKNKVIGMIIFVRLNNFCH